MFIRRLLVEHLRNLKQVSVDELSMLNCFVGDNGAGKTSLLEAISIISQGRSFRSHKIPTVIGNEHDSLSVFVECSDDQGKLNKLGIQRLRNNDYIVRINGETANKLADLSTMLPVVVLDAMSFQLLDGAPSYRRQFLDWGVFHVEHQFYDDWKNFNRILKQRNALLRDNQSDYDLYLAWDVELCRLASRLEMYRLSLLKQFQPIFISCLEQLDSELLDHSIFYKNGWGMDKLAFSEIPDEIRSSDNSHLLANLLKSSFQRDLKYQRTHLGPHKADIQIRHLKYDIKDIYSRGQKKTIIAALKLAQATVVNQKSGKSPVLLLDDLPSELDTNHLCRFIDYVISKGYQSFVTSVDKRFCSHIPSLKARMFHVERGKITPVND